MVATDLGRVGTLLWSALLQWSRVGTNAVVFLIIARWLDLGAIGAVAAVQAPVLVLQAVLTATIPDYIVQHDGNQRTHSTMFWASLAIGGLFSTILVLTAPLIARGLPVVAAIDYARVLSICPLLWSVSSVFEGRLRKALDTRRLALRTAMASLLSGGAAIGMLVYGAGAWAIVCFIVLNALCNMIFITLASAWRPGRECDLAYLRREAPGLLSLAGRHLLSAGVMPLLQYTVAVRLGVAAGGAFQIAVRLYTLVDALAVTPYRFLVMPLFARMRTLDDVARNLPRALGIGSLIAAPCYFGLAAMAGDLLPLVLGPVNGSASAALLRILCLYGPFAILPSVVMQVMAGRGYLHMALARSVLMYALAVLPAVAMATVSAEALIATYVLSGSLFGVAIGTMVAVRLFGARPWPLLRVWLGPLLAGALLLGVPPVLHVAVPWRPSLIALLFLLLATPIYIIGLAGVARPQLRMARDLVRGHRAVAPSSV